MSLNKLINAISGQESGGDYDAVSPISGASGRFQIMPVNWPSWSVQAGLPEGSEMTPANQDVVAEYKLGEYYTKYGAKGAAIAWYAGEDATGWSQEALDRPQKMGKDANGKVILHPSVNEYAHSVLARAGMDSDVEQARPYDLFEGRLGADPEGLGTFNPVASQTVAEIPKQPTKFSQFADSLILASTDTFLVGGLRQRMADISSGSLLDYNYNLTEEDKKYVTTALQGDPTAQEWVALNARSKAQMHELVAIKQQDLERKQRLARATDGWSQATQLAGSLIGGLLDPINLIPIGTSAKGLRTVSRLFPEGVIHNYQSLYKIARYADKVVEVGSKTGAMNMAQGYMSEKVGGFEQDYASLFGWGAVFGGGLHVMGDYLKGASPRTPEVASVMKALDVAETDNIKVASDMKPSNIQFTLAPEKIAQLSDVDYIKSVKNKNLTKLSKEGRVVVVDSAQLKAIADEANISLDDNVKAFYSKDTGMMMIVKDRINPAEIDKLVAHEIGVHGLPEVIGKAKYKRLMKYVKQEMNVEGSPFEASRKASGSYDPEEVLGYFVEHFADTSVGADNPLTTMVEGIKATFTKKGFKSEFSLDEIKSIVTKGLQQQLDNKLGITNRNPDGSVTFGNIKFSKNNFVNPLNLHENLRLEALVKKAQGAKTKNEFLQRVFSGLETSSFSPANTFYGKFIQGPSQTMSKLASMLFVDPQRTRSKGLTAQAYRDKALRKLQGFIFDGHEEMKKAYIELGYKDIEVLNQDIIEAFDMKHSKSTSGTWKSYEDVPVQIKKAVHRIELQREASGEFLASSSSQYLENNKNPNIIDDLKLLKETGFYVSISPDKVRTFGRKFNTGKELRAWVREYHEEFTDRTAVRRDLEADAERLYKEDLKTDLSAVRKEITTQDIENHIRAVANEISNNLIAPDEYLTGMGKEGGVWTGALSHMKHRLPTNRAGVKALPDGTLVSFNSTLRNNDIIAIQSGIIRREAGEGAFQAVFGDVDKYKKQRLQIAKEVDNSSLSNSEKEKLVNQWDALVNDLRGFPTSAEPLGTLDAWGRVFSSIAYSKSGANFTWGHLTEVMTSMGHLGWRGITHSIPKVNDAIAKMTMGEDLFKTATFLADDMYAKTIHDISFPMNKGIDYAIHSKFNSNSLHDKVIRTASDFGVRAGRVTSYLNQLPNLTYLFNRDVRKTLIADSIRLARMDELETRGIFDNPALLKAANINNIDKVLEPLKKYLLDSKDPQQGIKNWIAEDINSYNKWYALIDNASNIIVTNPNKIGEHTLKTANIATRLMFQFRDFPMRVINSQFLGAFTRRDKGAYLTIMYSMLGNGLIYAMQTGLKANLMFGDNEEKKKEYLDERLSPAMIGASAFFRSSIGTLPAIGLDMVELFSGSQVGRNIRNSLGTAYFEGKEQTKPDRAQGNVQFAIGNAIARTPAIDSTIGQLSRAGAGAYNLAIGRGNKKDLDDIVSLFNINFIPSKALQGFIIENDILTTLPDKKKRR